MTSYLARGHSMRSLPNQRSLGINHYNVENTSLFGRRVQGLSAKTQTRPLSSSRALFAKSEGTKGTEVKPKEFTEQEAEAFLQKIHASYKQMPNYNSPEYLASQKIVESKLPSRPQGQEAQVAFNLLVHAVHANAVDAILKDAEFLLLQIKEDYNLALLLNDKSTNFLDLFEGYLLERSPHYVLVNLMDALGNEGRMGQLAGTLSMFIRLVKDYKKELDITLTFADGEILAEEFLKEIQKSLEAQFAKSGEKIVFDTKYDPSILGGFKAVVGNERVLDYTLKAEMSSMEQFINGKNAEMFSLTGAPVEFETVTEPYAKTTRQEEWEGLIAKLKASGNSEQAALAERLTETKEYFQAVGIFRNDPPTIAELLNSVRDTLNSALNLGEEDIAAVKKSLVETLETLRERITTDIVFEKYLYENQVRQWKEKLLDLDEMDPEKELYQITLNLLESRVRPVFHVHVPRPWEKYTFEEIKKMTPQQIYELPLELKQRFTLDQVRQLPMDEVYKIHCQKSGISEPSMQEIIDNVARIYEMHNLDRDVLLVELDDQILQANLNRFSIITMMVRHYKRKDLWHLRQMLLQMNCTQLAKIFKISLSEIPKNLDKYTERLYQLRTLKMEIEPFFQHYSVPVTDLPQEQQSRALAGRVYEAARILREAQKSGQVEISDPREVEVIRNAEEIMKIVFEEEEAEEAAATQKPAEKQ